MKKHLFLILYSSFLFIFTLYLALDTFVIKKTYKIIEDNNEVEEKKVQSTITSNSYEDENIKITISESVISNTTVYVADIVLSDASYLKSAFAASTYGKNVVETTSSIANSNNAILAINGDYYGVQEKGYVLKNGVIYRSTPSDRTDLIIYKNGNFDVIEEKNVSIENLLDDNVYNLLSFGPTLIYDGKIQVDENTEVDRAMRNNPRTAIGIIDNLHYVFVVSDGRTNESEGLSLYELSAFMKSLNVDIAYNLDGGGSSTMYFNGKVINNPTTNGNRIKERSVSDIVYIGY